MVIEGEGHNYLTVLLSCVCVGNPRVHCQALSGIRECHGDPSLQNALQMAMRGLQYVMLYVQIRERESLILTSQT